MAVGALRQLRCGARSGVVPKNSLRSLCSLRSNSFGKHEDEARCARRPLLCAPRRHRDRPHRVPPAAEQERRHSNCCAPTGPPQSRVRSGCGAPLKRRVAQGLRPRAQRASSTDSSHLSERRERSEQSELCGGPQDRATQGSLRKAQTASVTHCGLSAHGFAARSTRVFRRARRTPTARRPNERAANRPRRPPRARRAGPLAAPRSAAGAGRLRSPGRAPDGPARGPTRCRAQCRGRCTR